MKLSRVASGQNEVGRNLGLVALLTCLLLPCLLLSILKSNLHAFSLRNLQLSINTIVQLERIQDDSAGSTASDTKMRIMPVALKKEPVMNQSSNPSKLESTEDRTTLAQNKATETVLDIQVTGLPNSSILYSINTLHTLFYYPSYIYSSSFFHTAIQVVPLQHVSGELQRENNTSAGADKFFETADIQMIGSSVSYNETQIEKRNNNTTIMGEKLRDSSTDLDRKLNKQISTTGNLVPQSSMWCDFSHDRFDTCFIHGDVRVDGPSSTLILASPSQSNATILKVRPYARKWESSVMETINELTLKSSSKPEEIPPCTVNHSVPAIIFSTGGFMGNFFHDFTDALVPLFITSRQYQGQVQFLITGYKAHWVNKYRAILSQLTKYEIINLDRQEGRVHCFPQAQVGLMSHKVMGINPTETPNGYTMDDFKDMLRTSFSLKRKSIRRGTRRPRLMILQRKKSRSLVNKREVVGLGRSLGFKVVVAGPEEMKNLSRFARSVNSADVMMGVHGAGLANMVFLPTGAPLIQIVPWGGLKWACWHDFGEPAAEMGVKYLEYEIKEEESTLIQQYPRDHPVFTDPQSVQKQGWNVLWSVFLDKQNVKLDVRRFKPTLLEALKSLQL